MESAPQPNHELREVRYEHSRDFVDILRQQSVSLLVSTYQAGKVAVLGSNSRGLALSFHNFEQAMGCATSEKQIAIGSKTQIWFLRNAEPVAVQLPREQEHDACYLTRSSHVTDGIDIHEMQWCGDELWFVNTRFSCLCTLDDDFSFVPRWKPPAVSQLSPEDRCHLNGLCCVDDLPRFVTAMSETDTAEGWRPVKATDGCIIDVRAGEIVARGFAMPHSPRVYRDRLWVLDSGRGNLSTVDPSSGHITSVSQQPGYTRGLAFAGPYAFIGLSKIRETSTFGGLPIAEKRDELKCAVAVVDLRTGKRVAYFEFLSGVEEIFDVQIVPGATNPFIYGPAAHVEKENPVWYAPAATALPSHLQPSSPVPTDAKQHFQRGNAFADEDRFQEAGEAFSQAINAAPNFADAHCNLGLAQQYQGNIDGAIKNLEQALALAPNFSAAHLNLATTLFLADDLQRAWHEYEWRWKCARFKKRPVAAAEIAPVWDGSSLSDRTLLVYGEQGIGDEVMFASCLPELIQQSADCIVACEPRLVPLLRRSFPDASVGSIDELPQQIAKQQISNVDFQIAAGSVPKRTRTANDDFPRSDRYLIADEARVTSFRNRLDSLGPNRKIGISWKGGSSADEQRRRSSNLSSWSALFNLPDTQFINLQYGDSATELADVQRSHGVTITNFPDVDPLQEIDSFAALIAALDMVVTIDNSTLHFAGALGVPTFGLITFPSSSYWRWFGKGETTPWYESVQLIRRLYPDPWEVSIEEVARMV